jgi:hypothetical protein
MITGIVTRLAVELLRFTSPDGQPIYINPEEVVAVRPSRPTDHFSGTVHCVMFLVDGKFIGLRETCDQVIEAKPEMLKSKPESPDQGSKK